MEQWNGLGPVEVNYQGQFLALDLAGKGGNITFKISPFPAEAQGSITLGLYSGSQGSEGYISSEVRPLADYERFETFHVPPRLEFPLFGIRLNQNIDPYEVNVSWILCEGCGDAATADNQGDLDLSKLIFPQRYCQLVFAPEIARPTTLKKIGSEYWVFNFEAPIARLNSSFEVVGTAGPAIGRPRPSNTSVDRVWDVLIDEPSDTAFFCCFSRNVVRAYQLSSLTDSPVHLGDIPSAQPGLDSWSSSSSARPFEAGYVRTVTGAALLPNGNLALASRQGVGGSSTSSVGAILEYSQSGDYVQTLVSFAGGGGLAQSSDYRDWFGKLRWIDGQLWAVSFRQKMAVKFELSLTGSTITAVTETYRRFLKPSPLPAGAAWTPHSLQVEGSSLLTSQNTIQGQNPGLARGLYSTSLETGVVEWSLGVFRDCGLPAYGEHPVTFVNPHDFLKVGEIDGKQAILIADFSLSRLSVLPIPESYQGAESFVEIQLPEAIAPRESLEQGGIVFDVDSKTLTCPISKLPIFTH